MPFNYADVLERLANKFRRQARSSGYYQAARNMKKQGVKFFDAYVILFGRMPRN